MQCTHGYAPKGKRCYGIHDWGAKGQTNVIGALAGKALVTVSLFNANTNTDIFTARIKQGPIPKLPKESVVIMDKAAFHKAESTKKALEAAGHTLEYLPPYSPDLNPIEKKWAHAKKVRRKSRKCSIQEFFKQNKF